MITSVLAGFVSCCVGALALIKTPPMRRTVCRGLALASLCVCVSAPPLVAAPRSARTMHPKSRSTTPALDIENLFRHWVRSYEEEPTGSGVQVFRPAASREFPPSRFRMAYKFARNGDCDWYSLSPDDDHRFRAGSWRIDPSDKTVLWITADGAPTAYRITELSREALRLTPLKPRPGR